MTEKPTDTVEIETPKPTDAPVKKGKCYNPDPAKNLGQHAITGGPGRPKRKRTMADDVKKGAWKALKKRGLEAAFLQALDEAPGQVIGLLKSVVEMEMKAKGEPVEDLMTNAQAAELLAELKAKTPYMEPQTIKKLRQQIKAQRQCIRDLEKRVAEAERGPVVVATPREPPETKEQTKAAQGGEFIDEDGVRCVWIDKIKYRVA